MHYYIYYLYTLRVLQLCTQSQIYVDALCLACEIMHTCHRARGSAYPGGRTRPS